MSRASIEPAPLNWPPTVQRIINGPAPTTAVTYSMLFTAASVISNQPSSCTSMRVTGNTADATPASSLCNSRCTMPGGALTATRNSHGVAVAWPTREPTDRKFAARSNCSADAPPDACQSTCTELEPSAVALAVKVPALARGPGTNGVTWTAPL